MRTEYAEKTHKEDMDIVDKEIGSLNISLKAKPDPQARSAE